MTTLNEYLTTGLKALEQWRPFLPSHRNRRFRLPELFDESREDDKESSIVTAEKRSELHENDAWPPSLEAILSHAEEYPSHSAILGVCEDGLPFLLDFTNPAPGSALIAGDPSSGKTRLLKAILNSVAIMNYPDQIVFNLIVNDLEGFAELEETDHCQQVHQGGIIDVGELIEELAGIAEQRRQNWMQDPVIILAIDDLAACLETLDDQPFGRLYWLIKHGPRSRVWTIATLNAEEATRIEPHFLSAFRTRLVGHISNQRLAGYLSGDDKLPTRELENGSQFYVTYGDTWMRFWICD